MMHVGFSGTREGMTAPQLNAVRAEFDALRGTLHHGDCIGADAEAHAAARTVGMKVHGHPPSNPKLRAFCQFDSEEKPYPYLTRNSHIVDATAVLIAAPKGEEGQSGTWSTINYALRRGKPVRAVMPDGEVRILP